MMHLFQDTQTYSDISYHFQRCDGAGREKASVSYSCIVNTMTDILETHQQS